MQTTFILEINFSEAAFVKNACPASAAPIKETVDTYDPAAQYKLGAFYMYDKVIAFDETSCSVQAE